MMRGTRRRHAPAIKNLPMRHACGRSQGIPVRHKRDSHLPEYICRNWHPCDAIRRRLPRLRRAGPSTSLDKSAIFTCTRCARRYRRHYYRSMDWRSVSTGQTIHFTHSIARAARFRSGSGGVALDADLISHAGNPVVLMPGVFATPRQARGIGQRRQIGR